MDYLINKSVQASSLDQKFREMASSGDISESSIHKGSGEDFNICCETCEEDGNVIEASGYCENCEEYLCMACMASHCRPKPTRHHVVKKLQDNPNPFDAKTKVKMCTEHCKRHPIERLKFFCKGHDVSGCGDCMVLEHKACDVEYISKVAEGYDTCEEYTNIVEKVQKLQVDINAALANADKTSKKAEDTVQTAIGEFKQYRRDVEDYLNGIENELTTNCEKIRKHNEEQVINLNKTFGGSIEQLIAMHNKLTDDVSNTSNLFVWTRSSRHAVEKFIQNLKESQKTQLRCISFKKNATIAREVVSETDTRQFTFYSFPMTFVRRQPFDLILHHKQDLVSSELFNGTRTCNLTSFVNLRDNVIVSTDNLNKCVLLLDMVRCKVLSCTSVKFKPWDVVCISQKSIAVTLTSGNIIQRFDIDEHTLNATKTIPVDGECRGIDSANEKFVVTFGRPPKVEIIDFHGNVITRIQHDSFGNQLFKYPCFIVANRSGDQECVFVSDVESSNVVKLSLDGVVLTINDQICKPRGIHMCRDGSVLVSAFNSVHVISSDCQRHRALIGPTRGVYYSGGICYDEDYGLLYVRRYGDGGIDVIQTFIL